MDKDYEISYFFSDKKEKLEELVVSYLLMENNNDRYKL